MHPNRQVVNMVLNHGCINGQIQVAGGGDLKSGDGIFQLLHGNRDTCLGGDFTDGHRNRHGRPGRRRRKWRIESTLSQCVSTRFVFERNSQRAFSGNSSTSSCSLVAAPNGISTCRPHYLRRSFRAGRRTPRRLLSDQLQAPSFPVEIPRCAVAGFLSTPIHDKQRAVRAILFATVCDERWGCSMWTHVNWSKRQVAANLAAQRIPNEKVIAPRAAGAGANDKVSGEVSSHVPKCAKYGRITTGAPYIGSRVLG